MKQKKDGLLYSTATPVHFYELLEFCKVVLCEDPIPRFNENSIISNHSNTNNKMDDNTNGDEINYSGDNSSTVDDVPYNIRIFINRIIMTLQSPRLPLGFQSRQSAADGDLLVEDALVAIAVWLRSYSIILELKEYWTLLQKNSDSLAKNRSSDNCYGITLQQNESNRKNVSSPNKNS